MSKADDNTPNPFDFAAMAKQMNEQITAMTTWADAFSKMAPAMQAAGTTDSQNPLDPQNMMKNFKMPEMPEFPGMPEMPDMPGFPQMDMSAFDFPEAMKNMPQNGMPDKMPLPNPAKVVSAQLELLQGFQNLWMNTTTKKKKGNRQ